MFKAEPTEQYLKTFHWNKVKYRADKPLGEIIDTLQKVPIRPNIYDLNQQMLTVKQRKYRV